MEPAVSRGRVWLEINLATLTDNFRKIATAVAPARVIAVLKANAYGLGGQPIAAALARAGVSGFGVAEPTEALALVPLGLPVQILGSVLPEEIAETAAAGVILPVTDPETACRIDAVGAHLGRRVKVHIKIDTGMGRLGILLRDALRVVPEIARLPHLDCEGIYSHFSAAYRAGGTHTQTQLDGFIELLAQLERQGIVFACRHIANSDALNNVRRAVQPPFNCVRTGINLHGTFDTEGQRTLDLHSVLSLRTRLTAVRRLPAGMSIGYGCTYTLPCDTWVGTISAGYADGLPLALSNRGHVLIRERACPVLGRISMDYTTVSLEQVPDAAVGDEVICLGGNGPCAVSVADWAQLKGTHPYEIICSFGNRVVRRYVEMG